MKQWITMLLVTVIALNAQAQQHNNTDWNKKRYEHVKERTISRSFPAAGNTLSIDNSFGDVTVVASGGNEIKV